MLQLAYSFLMSLALPFYMLRLWRRGAQRSAGARPGWRELGIRLGYYSDNPQQEGVDCWIHAVSVGEARLALRLTAALWRQDPELRVLISSTTATGFAVVTNQLEPRLQQCYAPYDLASVVRRFVRHYQPRRALFVETELWPNALRCLQAAGIPSFLINARMSASSARGYSRIPGHAALFFQPLHKVYAQWDADAERLIALGVRPDSVRAIGSLKLDVTVEPEGQASRARLGLQPEDRLVVFASTQPGEESLLLPVLRAVLAHADTIKVALVPRHPHRAQELLELVADLQPQLYSNYKLGGSPWRLLLIDKIGQLQPCYRAAELAFIGGSLVEHGGQNMVEALSLGVASVVGPSTHNFAEITKRLLECGGLRQVQNSEQLLGLLLELLQDAHQRQSLVQAAQAFLQGYRGLYDQLAQELLTN